MKKFINETLKKIFKKEDDVFNAVLIRSSVNKRLRLGRRRDIEEAYLVISRDVRYAASRDRDYLELCNRSGELNGIDGMVVLKALRLFKLKHPGFNLVIRWRTGPLEKTKDGNSMQFPIIKTDTLHYISATICWKK